MFIPFKIRKDLITNFTYVRLTSMLYLPDSGMGVFSPKVYDSYKETVQFINSANEKQLLLFGPNLLNALEPILTISLKNFPPKRDIDIVSNSFLMLEKVEPSLLSYGIPFEWLDQNIDVSKFYNLEIPYHARIGTGHHAGNWSLEEGFLMDDSFFFLVKAEKELNSLLELHSELKKTEKNGYASEEIYLKARAFNLNVCSYARTSILTFYSAVECFANSIGNDFLLRNIKNLTTTNIEILKGKKNNKYITLETKFKLLSEIINTSGSKTTKLDFGKEPFKTFFNEFKTIRDSSVHYSPLKSPIWKKPVDWVEDARKYSKIVMDVVQKFWSACYPTKIFPYYLKELDYNKFYNDVVNRI